MSTTATARDWWVSHADRAGLDWAHYYWEDWSAPHRQHIPLALALVAPVESLYEIGCNSGPNLRLARRYFPHLKLGGLEVAEVAATMAHDRLGVPIEQGSLPDDLPDSEWDVVLSCYTMAYLDPEDAHTTMLRLNRMARLAIILLEPMAVGALPVGQCRDDGLPEWRHDYERTFHAIGWRTAWKWPLIPPKQHTNAVLILQR